jgi:hypothetical protein
MGQFIRADGDYNITTVDGGTITLDTGLDVGRVLVTGDLAVQGALSLNLLTVDNILLDEGIVQSIEGDLLINPATEEDRVVIGPAVIPKIYGDVVVEGNIFADNIDIGGIVGDSIDIGNFRIDGDIDLTLLSTIETNSNLYIEANGIGTVELRSNTNITGDLTVTGDISIGGNIIIGNDNVDNITVIADFTSDLVPNESGEYDLGKTDKQWQTVYAGKFIGEVYGGTY